MILSILAALFLFVLILPHLRAVIWWLFVVTVGAALWTISPFIYQAILDDPETCAMLFAGFLFAVGVIYAANRPVRPRKPASQTFAFKLGRRLGQLLLNPRIRGANQNT